MTTSDKAHVFWLTGLSGAGKTTLGRLLVAWLQQAGRAAVLLDGDVLRAIFDREGALDAGARRTLAGSYGRLCRELASQGIDVVCATISMFHSVRAWNRENIPGYREIYLRVPMEELQRRDSKGIYAGHRWTGTGQVVGLDLVMEEPLDPDLVIDHHGIVCPADALQLALDTFYPGRSLALRVSDS